MSKVIFPLIGAVTLLAAATALPGATRGGTDPALRCALEIDEHRGVVTARAVLEAHLPVSGRFALELERRDAAGLVDLGQSGPFDLSRGARAVLNDVALSGRARDLRARLTLETGGRVLRCPVVLNGIPQEET